MSRRDRIKKFPAYVRLETFLGRSTVTPSESENYQLNVSRLDIADLYLDKVGSATFRHQLFVAVTGIEAAKENAVRFISAFVKAHEEVGVTAFARWQMGHSSRSELIGLQITGLLAVVYCYRPTTFASLPDLCLDLLMGVNNSPHAHAALAISQVLLEFGPASFRLLSISARLSLPMSVPTVTTRNQNARLEEFGRNLMTKVYGSTTYLEARRSKWSSVILIFSKMAFEMSSDFIAIPFGSVASGFYSVDSDVDICICPSGTPAPGLDTTRKGQLTQCNALRSLVTSYINGAVGFTVVKARVPILSGDIIFKDDPVPLHVEVSFFNLVGTRNTFALRKIAECCPEIVPVGVALKKLTSAFSDNKQGGLVSVAWTMLYIRFIQTKRSDIIPPSLFSTIPNSAHDTYDVLRKSVNGPLPPIFHSLSQVPVTMAEFFKFCCQDFPFFSEIVDLTNKNVSFDTLVKNGLTPVRSPDWNGFMEDEEKSQIFFRRPICVADTANGERLLSCSIKGATSREVAEMTFQRLWWCWMGFRNVIEKSTVMSVENVDVFSPTFGETSIENLRV